MSLSQDGVFLFELHDFAVQMKAGFILGVQWLVVEIVLNGHELSNVIIVNFEFRDYPSSNFILF